MFSRLADIAVLIYLAVKFSVSIAHYLSEKNHYLLSYFLQWSAETSLLIHTWMQDALTLSWLPHRILYNHSLDLNLLQVSGGEALGSCLQHSHSLERCDPLLRDSWICSQKMTENIIIREGFPSVVWSDVEMSDDEEIIMLRGHSTPLWKWLLLQAFPQSTWSPLQIQ